MRRATQAPDSFEAEAAEAVRLSILRGLPATLSDAVLAAAVRVELPPRRVLDGQSFDLVVAGLVREFVSGPDGRQVTVSYLGQGDVVGFGRLAGQQQPVACETMTDCRVLRIPPSRFDELRSTQPDVSWAATEELARHLDDVVDGIALSAFGSVRERVIYHLLALSTPRLARKGLVCSAGQQQLAQAAGSVREVVARVLKDLRSEGLVTSYGRETVIPDPARLQSEIGHLPGRLPHTQMEPRSRSA